MNVRRDFLLWVALAAAVATSALGQAPAPAAGPAKGAAQGAALEPPEAALRLALLIGQLGGNLNGSHCRRGAIIDDDQFSVLLPAHGLACQRGQAQSQPRMLVPGNDNDADTHGPVLNPRSGPP